MIAALPLRHRTAMAVGLYLVALVSGAWASTLVGDPDPTVWGVALGGFAGLALALAMVLTTPALRPAVSRSGPPGGAPARR